MATVINPGTQAPEFTLLNGSAKPVKLSDYRGKNVVLAFYPADWSPVCTSELALIQETLGEIRDYNAEVLGVSVDNHWSHRAWAEHLHVTFPLLADFWPHGQVARRYGVFRETDGISDRALYFIDAAGVIRDSWVTENPAVAPGLNVIFDALERIHGAHGKETSGA